MKTLEDIKRVAEITDNLRKLGVPESICNRIDVWNRKQEERIQDKCKYCKEPIYSFQESVKADGKLYHSGCKRIKDNDHNI